MTPGSAPQAMARAVAVAEASVPRVLCRTSTWVPLGRGLLQLETAVARPAPKVSKSQVLFATVILPSIYKDTLIVGVVGQAEAVAWTGTLFCQRG